MNTKCAPLCEVGDVSMDGQQDPISDEWVYREKFKCCVCKRTVVMREERITGEHLRTLEIPQMRALIRGLFK